MSNDNGWLVSKEERVQTPHRYIKGDKRIMPVDFIVIHYSASLYDPSKPQFKGSNPDKHRSWLTGLGPVSSTHFSTLRDGSIIQASSIDDRTWHAGVAQFVRDGKVYKNINYRSIGIDLDNVGYLKKVGDKYYDWAAEASYAKSKEWRRPYQGPTPFADNTGRYWEPYTHLNVARVLRLINELSKIYPILSAEPWRIVGHSDVKSTKADPGPALPWELIRAAATPAFKVESIPTLALDAFPGVVAV